MTLAEFIEGPLWYLSAAVFVAGVAWRIVSLVMIGKPREQSVAKGSSAGGAVKAVLLHSVPLEELEHEARAPFVGIRFRFDAERLVRQAGRLQLADAIAVAAAESRRAGPAMITVRPDAVNRLALTAAAGNRAGDVTTFQRR